MTDALPSSPWSGVARGQADGYRGAYRAAAAVRRYQHGCVAPAALVDAQVFDFHARLGADRHMHGQQPVLQFDIVFTAAACVGDRLRQPAFDLPAVDQATLALDADALETAARLPGHAAGRGDGDRQSTRLNSSPQCATRMAPSAGKK